MSTNLLDLWEERLNHQNGKRGGHSSSDSEVNAENENEDGGGEHGEEVCLRRLDSQNNKEIILTACIHCRV